MREGETKKERRYTTTDVWEKESFLKTSDKYSVLNDIFRRVFFHVN